MRWWSSNGAPLGALATALSSPRKSRRENRAAAVTIMEENIDLIFSLRRAAFLLHPLPSTVQREHLFTKIRNFRRRKITHRKKHKKNQNFTKKTNSSSSQLKPTSCWWPPRLAPTKNTRFYTHVPGNRFLFEATAANEKWLLLLLCMSGTLPFFHCCCCFIQFSLALSPTLHHRRHPRV